MYLEHSPDYNFFIQEGNLDRIAANRTVLCIFTEFALCNNRKMKLEEYNNVIFNIQKVTNNKGDDIKC